MDRERDDRVSFLGDIGRLKASLTKSHMSFDHWQNPPQQPVNTLEDRVNLLASHMTKQWCEHDEAIRNTNRMFDRLLSDMAILCGCFKESFEKRAIPQKQIYYQIDSDRSVGILNILWHTLSFTTRGNTKPMAMYRFGREPVFTGRIVAVLGDFQEMAGNPFGQDFGELLSHEVASLYVPADTETPAVMSIKHLGDDEHYFHQADAPRQFLLKTIEMVCAGGYFHEKEFY
jgi:hypothetical protein